MSIGTDSHECSRHVRMVEQSEAVGSVQLVKQCFAGIWALRQKSHFPQGGRVAELEDGRVEGPCVDLILQRPGRNFPAVTLERYGADFGRLCSPPLCR